MGYDRQEIYRKAESYRAKRRYKRALKEYHKIYEMDPEDMQVLARMAELYRLTKRPREAMDFYERVVNTYIKDDRLDKAYAIYVQMIDLEPRETSRYHEAAEILVSWKRQKDAASLYRKGLKHYKSKKFRHDKLNFLTRILDLEPQDHCSRLMAAKLCRKMGNNDEAIDMLKQGIHLTRTSRRRKWRNKFRWRLFLYQPSFRNFFKVLSFS